MIDSTTDDGLRLVQAAPDATIALEQASSLICGRSRRLEHPVLRLSLAAVESTI